MNTRNRIVSMLVAIGAIAVLGGCFGSSPSSRFYTLTPLGSSGISASEGMEVVVRVGPVSIPSYLDRRQIVTRNGRNGVEIADYERWSGSLDDEIVRLLVNDLAARLTGRGISVVPWRSVTLADAPTIYRIPLNIDRFDGVLGETVVLNAFWAVVVKKDKQEQVIMARESTLTEAVGGKGYDAFVSALGRTVERLGKEMADGLLPVAGQTSPK